MYTYLLKANNNEYNNKINIDNFNLSYIKNIYNNTSLYDMCFYVSKINDKFNYLISSDYYNNNRELINPFLDELMILNKCCNDCTFISLNPEIYKNSKYEHIVKNFKNIYGDFDSHNDLLTIHILSIITQQDYLKNKYSHILNYYFYNYKNSYWYKPYNFFIYRINNNYLDDIEFINIHDYNNMREALTLKTKSKNKCINIDIIDITINYVISTTLIYQGQI